MRTRTILSVIALSSAPHLASAQLGAHPLPPAPLATAPAPTPFALPSSTPAPEPAVPAVELARHRMHVTMEGGFAVVAEELTLGVSSQQRFAHVTELAVPASAELVALEACQAGACRAGTAVTLADEVFDSAQYGFRTAGNAPLVLAEREGERLLVRVAGLEVGTATIRVVWSTTTERIGGRERVRMPARDDAPELVLASPSLEHLAIDGDPTLTNAPRGRAFDLLGTVPDGAPTLEVGSITDYGRGFVRVSAPHVPPGARPVVILLDASPSARHDVEAMDAALAMLLEETPDGSSVRVIAFARRARTIAEGDVATLRRDGVHVPGDLGPSTSLRAALTTLGPVPDGATLVWLSDGATGPSGGEADARAELARLGVREHVVAPTNAQRIGNVDLVGDPWAARARLASSFAETVEETIGDRVVRVVAGESVLVSLRSIDDVPSTAIATRVPLIASGPVIRASLGWVTPRTLLTLDPRDRHAANKTARGLLGIFIGGGGLEAPTHGFRRIGCGCGVTYTYGGVSREAYARMMARLRAPVSACFAEARDGDPSFEARATFVLTMQGDELAAAHVETSDPELRACLLATLDHLVIPASEGSSDWVTVLRYPFVTSPVDAHVDVTPLAVDTAVSIDRAFADEPSVPPMSLLGSIAEPGSSLTR